MITQDAIRDRVDFNNIHVSYVYNPAYEFADHFIKQCSCNMAEFGVSDLNFHGHSASAVTSMKQALRDAQLNKKRYLLYVEVGNIVDWADGIATAIQDVVRNNPELKFAGHILQAPNRSFYIHPQFFLIDVKWAIDNKVERISEEMPREVWDGPILERSEENFHDNYTPVWVKATGKTKTYKGKFRGANIINQLARTNSVMMPWPREVRDQKKFLYPTVKQEVAKQKPAIFKQFDTARVYVANTEDISYSRYKNVLKGRNYGTVFTPASGVNTFLLGFYAKPKKLVAYDISTMALSFIQVVRERWDGKNFKEFVNDVILYDKSLGPIYKATGKMLDDADILLKSFGNEFVDWWQSGTTTYNVQYLDIFNQDTYFKFKKFSIENEDVLLNLSNIMHYAPTATLFSLQERVEIVKNIKNYFARNVSGQLMVHGMNPLLTDSFQGPISDSQLDERLIKQFPWNRR